MQISRTPMRVSFVGGGTDIENYYSRFGGEVISCAINKYIYVTLNKRDDDKIVICYSEIETTYDINEIKHPIVREALKMAGIKGGGIEIHIIANISTIGTGLGGSSAVAVGLLRLLFPDKSREDIAALACELEINRLGKRIGKQDQYACALGGLNHLYFEKDGSVCCTNMFRNPLFSEHTMFLVPVNSERKKAERLLDIQNDCFENNIDKLHCIKETCNKFKEAVFSNNSSSVIQLLNEYWDIKKTLSTHVSNDDIDKLIDKYRDENCGVKLCGAGQGGFLFVYDAKRKGNEIPIRVDYLGTTIIKNL